MRRPSESSPQGLQRTVVSKVSLLVPAVGSAGKPICLTPSSDALKINVDYFHEEDKSLLV